MPNKADAPLVQGPGVLAALAKAKSITRPPKGPGERLFGPGFGSMTDKLAEMMTQGSFSEEPGPLDLMMAAPLGLPKMINVLTKGPADRMLAETPSRVLRAIREYGWMGGGMSLGRPELAERLVSNPIGAIQETVGSPGVARIASGQTFAGGKPGIELGQSGIPRHEIRLAQDELYRITQALLDEMGIPANETVTSFRGGPIRNPVEHFLNPVSTQEHIAEQFTRQAPTKFEIPRSDIRALPGILARGDDVTLSEMLVPASTLKRNIVAGNPQVVSEDFSWLGAKGIPSRLRREIAKSKVAPRPQTLNEIRDAKLDEAIRFWTGQ